MKAQPITGLLGDFRALLILFVTLRVVLLMAYQPFLLGDNERGLGVGGDRLYSYQLTALAQDDLFVFRDWWSEFPPIWYLTTTAVYVGLGKGASYDNWSLGLGLVMLLAEVGTLIIVRKIGARLYDDMTGMAVAWVYALLVVPIVFMWWNFDAMVTFFTLLAVWLLLIERDVRSASMVAVGALTKFVSALLLGAVIRFYDTKRATRYALVAMGLFAVAYVPLFALNSDFALISLTAQFNKPSYQTVWALLDGNYSTGNFGSIESHLTKEGVNDGVSDKNPARIPSWLRLGVASLIGLAVFVRTRRFDQLGVVAFFAITLLIFYLQSQGWSPQWLTLILPLILLVFPTRNGVYISVMLSILAFVEYPFIFVRTGDTNGVILPDNPMFGLWVMVVLTRTLILVGVCGMLVQKLRQQPNPDLAIG
jgi:hypothetical protein